MHFVFKRFVLVQMVLDVVNMPINAIAEASTLHELQRMIEACGDDGIFPARNGFDEIRCFFNFSGASDYEKGEVCYLGHMTFASRGPYNRGVPFDQMTPEEFHDVLEGDGQYSYTLYGLDETFDRIPISALFDDDGLPDDVRAEYEEYEMICDPETGVDMRSDEPKKKRDTNASELKMMKAEKRYIHHSSTERGIRKRAASRHERRYAKDLCNYYRDGGE